jgi:formate C-acetyltransferase
MGVALGEEAAEGRDFSSFEEFYGAFIAQLRQQVRETSLGARLPREGLPAPLLSIFVGDCIERGLGYHEGGARYNVSAPHAGGLPDVANSLHVLKKVVFDTGEVGYRQFVEILRGDWAGHEELRLGIRKHVVMYGNDDDEADGMLRRVFDDYVGLVEELADTGDGMLRPAGISTFGREIDWRGSRAAAPHGTRAGEILATNFAPTPGTDTRGPTAVIKSFTKVDYTRLPNGTPLELKLHPSCVAGGKGLEVLVGLLRTFVALGGMYLQVDVVDSEVLRDAQRHPERYPNLAVRIAGWSARFTTLSSEWQEMVIRRTQQFVR